MQVRAPKFYRPKFYKPKFYTLYLRIYLHKRITSAHHRFTIARAHLARSLHMRACGMELARERVGTFLAWEKKLEKVSLPGCEVRREGYLGRAGRELPLEPAKGGNMKNISDLCQLEMLALSKALDASRVREVNSLDTLPEGESIEVDFTVRIAGTLSRGKGSERKATNRARTAGAMCALLAASGAVRTHSAGRIVRLWREIGTLDKEGFDRFIASLDDEARRAYDLSMRLFDDVIVAKLPTIPAKGAVKLK